MGSLLDNLEASCRVQASQTIGSATIIYSKDGNTFAITNHHVVAKNIQYKDQWDNILQREIKNQFLSPVEVLFPKIEDNDVVGYNTRSADIIIYNKEQDMALLKIKSKDMYPSVNLYPREETRNIKALTPLGVIGAALGETPVFTEGKLQTKQKIIDNYEYWLSTALSIYGNSGGGVFTPHNGEWKFIGIPSRIAVTGGFSSQAITHLGYFIPPFRVYDWLEDECFQFIYDDSFDMDKCTELRKEKKQHKRMEMLTKMG